MMMMVDMIIFVPLISTAQSNYDGDGDNIDEIYDKNYQKTY